jgi:alginate O-acetyltransferase complex protein AlgI
MGSDAVLLVMGVIGSPPAVKKLFTVAYARERIRPVLAALQAPAMLSLLVLITAYLVDGSFNPFLYFRF